MCIEWIGLESNWIATDIISSIFPPLFSLSLLLLLFLPLLQMHPWQLVISWISLSLLASPLMAIWELEKNGNQALLLCSGPETQAQTYQAGPGGKSDQKGQPGLGAS